MTENAPLPTSPEALMARLEAMGIPFVLHEHAAVFTVDEAAALKDRMNGVQVKNLFLKDKKDNMALVVLPDEMAIDLKALAPLIGLDRISFGSPERLWQYLGVRPGSVCPFCAMNDTGRSVKVVLHAPLATARVCAHPMLNTMSLEVEGPDLVRFLAECGHTPHLVDLTPCVRAAA